MDQAKKDLQKQSCFYIKKLQKQRQRIVRKKEKYKVEKDAVLLYTEFVIEKPITTYKDVTEQELSQEESNEFSGEND